MFEVIRESIAKYTHIDWALLVLSALLAGIGIYAQLDTTCIETCEAHEERHRWQYGDGHGLQDGECTCVDKDGVLRARWILDSDGEP